jgi:tryptophanyl-tRNA synthetase
MSKSYDNVIPLFAPPAQMRKQIAAIVTDSRAPGEPKEVEGSALFQIYQAFASEEEAQALRRAYAEGIAWADAKQLLFERIDREIAPMRERYQHLVSHPGELEAILSAGAQKARDLAVPFMARLRHAVGLRDLGSRDLVADKAMKAALPSFKQYRENDGRHYFKLVDGAGRLLLQSNAFDSPREAGQAVARLKQSGSSEIGSLTLPEGVSQAQIEDALQMLRVS